MTTPSLTPNDHERLAQIDELIASGTPSADPAANWLRRQRPPINSEHYDQLKKEILTMNIDDLTPKRKKSPVRWLPRLLKAAAALALLAGAYVAGLAARPMQTSSMSGMPMNPITGYPPDLIELSSTQIIANATAHVQQFAVPTPPSIPFVSSAEFDGNLPMAVTVPLSHTRSFDYQPLNLQAGQRVALYLRLSDDDDDEREVFILLTENAVVSHQIRPNYGYELQLDASIGSIISQLVSPGLLSEALLYIDPRP